MRAGNCGISQHGTFWQVKEGDRGSFSIGGILDEPVLVGRCDMANSTLKAARAIHGSNPQASLKRCSVLSFGLIIQFLIEKVIRARIYDSLYWKEQCFALTGKHTSSSSHPIQI